MNELEKDVIEAARKGITEAIIGHLSGYNSPLKTLVDNVMATHEPALNSLINGEFDKLLGGDEFKAELQKALNQKLAKILVARMGGELEKRVNELKQNPETRAKITLAISEIIETL